MLLESAGLALLASLSPTALLIAAVYLGSARPMRTAAFYLTGALVMTAVTGVVILVLLRSLDLSHTAERDPRYELRLALGVALLVIGLVVARRQPRPADPAQPQQGLISRMAASPAPRSAFIVGIPGFCPRGDVPGCATGNCHGKSRPGAHSPGDAYCCRHKRPAGVVTAGPVLARTQDDDPLLDLVQWLAAGSRPHGPGMGPAGSGVHHGRQRDLRAGPLERQHQDKLPCLLGCSIWGRFKPIWIVTCPNWVNLCSMNHDQAERRPPSPLKASM